ncbi:hypothetical protein ACTXT7_010771 [Hymenolepis weldensis]
MQVRLHFLIIRTAYALKLKLRGPTMIFLSDPSEEPLILIKFFTIGTLINILHQVFANPGLSNISVPEISSSSPTRIEDLCRSINIPFLNLRLISMAWISNLLTLDLDTCDLPPPWNPETPQTSAIIGPTFTPDASEELKKDFRFTQRVKLQGR